MIDANGGALLPGLHDHHIHLCALAARNASILCGPPQVTNRAQFAAALAAPGAGWIRAIGYHESILSGLPTARELDRFVPQRPLRMQHRSGRMWLINSAGLEELLAKAPPPPGFEREGGRFTGRLFDEDPWLRKALDSSPPDCSAVSAELARHGVTGVTDMSPHNDPSMAAHFSKQMQSGAVLQHCQIAGALSLADAQPGPWRLGPAKLHLHEAALPDFDETVQFYKAAHDQGRKVAIHCVSEVELVFALATLEAAANGGGINGDRIEHASVASPELVTFMHKLGLSVCSQPHFVAERGDRYLADVEQRHHPDLYRLRSLILAGIPLAGGSDAPFGSADPWAAMRAAVSRETGEGRIIGGEEALSPEDALALFLADPEDFTRQRRIAIGTIADLCLLDRPWGEARKRLLAADVTATLVSGRIVHNRINQAPIQSVTRT